MKKSKARIVILLMSCILIMSSLMACVSGKTDDPVPKLESIKDQDNTVSSSGIPNMTEPGVLPIVDKQATIIMGLVEEPSITDYKDNHFTKWIEEQTGINLEFELFPNGGAEAIQKIELLVASKSKLPDILSMDTTEEMRENYGTGGSFIALDDYFEKYAYFFPKELAKQYDENQSKDLFNIGRSSDGKLYGFPNVGRDPTSGYGRQWYINQKWLDYLKLDKPDTTDQLYSVLKSFKEKDPNQNKKADEIPLIGGLGWNQQVDKVILSAFTYIPYQHYFVVENGKIDVCFIKEEYKEGLRYINKLCRENLCSPVSFTQASDQLKATLDLTTAQDSYVGIWCGAAAHLFSIENEKVLEYEALGPITGPEGVCWSEFRPATKQFNSAITKDCKTPEIAFRLLDFLKTEEASLRGRYGVKGVDWEYMDGTKIKGPLDDLGFKVIFKSDNLIWGSNNNSIWYTNAPTFMNERLNGGRAQVISDNKIIQHRSNIAAEGFNMRYGKIPSEIVQERLYTKKEKDEISEIEASINTYVEESRTRFIIGELDIEKDWDNYIKDLNKIGLKRYIEITQDCYTRMNK